VRVPASNMIGKRGVTEKALAIRALRIVAAQGLGSRRAEGDQLRKSAQTARKSDRRSPVDRRDAGRNGHQRRCCPAADLSCSSSTIEAGAG
jgi:hypothetical protein